MKALRGGEGSIAESYATIEGEEVWLINSHIPEYSHGNRMNHEPRRRRKLLLKGREIAKLHGAVARQGLTLVPLSIYFNSNGRAKVELAVARGKKVHDKRDTDQGARLEARAGPADAGSVADLFRFFRRHYRPACAHPRGAAAQPLAEAVRQAHLGIRTVALHPPLGARAGSPSACSSASS